VVGTGGRAQGVTGWSHDNNLFIREEGNYKKGNVGGELSFILRKWKLKRNDVINYNFNNPTKKSSGGGEGSEGGNSLCP